MCLMVVKLAGAWSVRMRHSSSRKTMSMTQCRLFSTAQWLRTITARLLAGRLSEVMKSRVSRSIVRPISRMLSTMTTPFKPGQSWRSCNQETARREGGDHVDGRLAARLLAGAARGLTVDGDHLGRRSDQ